MTNTICSEQNEDRQLERLAAQSALYSASKTIFGIHATLSTVVVAGLAVGAMFYADVKPWAVASGYVVLLADTFWLTPRQKMLREQAAHVQESFDCEVLGLPPGPPLKIGKSIDHEVVVEYAAAYRRKDPALRKIRDWYPSAACRMPLYLGRVVCQRTNAWWDGKQRRHYSSYLSGGVVVVTLSVLAIGLARRMPLGDLVVTMAAPLASGIGLVLKQYRENSDAAARLDKLKAHAEDLFLRALAGATEAELTTDSRTLQDEIFDHRKRNVPVFDQLYDHLRGKQEVQMKANAEEMVRRLEAKRPSTAIDAPRTTTPELKGG